MSLTPDDSSPGQLEHLQQEIRAALHAQQDPTYAAGKLIPTAGTFLGVRVPVIRQLSSAFRKQYPHLSLEIVCRLLDLFCAERGREEILFATFVLASSRRQLGANVWGHIPGWIAGIDNWETCDQLATQVAGEMVAQDLTRVADLVAWAQAPNPWQRRFAVAATTALNQKGRSFPQETFQVCDPVLADPDPWVQKAVSWAIREICKTDEAAAFAFLRQNQHRSHPYIVREASTKLTPAHQALIKAARTRP